MILEMHANMATDVVLQKQLFSVRSMDSEMGNLPKMGRLDRCAGLLLEGLLADAVVACLLQ